MFNRMFLYDEMYSQGEYTFGFELEGFCESVEDKDDFGSWARNFWKTQETLDKKRIQGKGEMQHDSSVSHNNPDYYHDEECYECNGVGTWDCENCNGTGETFYDCDTCGGDGKLTCSECDGSGDTNCTNCNGTGKDPDGQMNIDGEVAECYECQGSGKIDCVVCNGTEEVPCPDCEGEGKITGECEDCNGEREIRCEYCGGRGIYESDNSDSDTRTFEFASPIISATTKNLFLVSKFLDMAVNEQGVSTNKSCSLHIHIGFPNKENLGAQMFWILCQMVQTDGGKKLEELSKHEGFILLNPDYASNDFLTYMKHDFQKLANIIKEYKRTYPDVKENSHEFEDMIVQHFSSKFKQYYTDTKYRLFRIHSEHNTLEWRGPRKFLDKKGRDVIKSFFIEKLRKLILWIDETLDKQYLEVGEYKITRDLFFKMFKYNMLGEVIRDREKTKKQSNEINFDLTGLNALKLLPQIFKQFPWITRFSIKNMKPYIVDDNLVLKEGFISKKRNKAKPTIEYIHFVNSNIDEVIIKDIMTEHCTIHNSVIDGGEFLETDIREGTIINGGTFKNSRLIEGSIHNGTFSNCELYYDNVTWIGGEWKNGKIEIKKVWGTESFDCNEDPYVFINKHFKQKFITDFSHYVDDVVKLPDVNTRAKESFEKYKQRVINSDELKKVREGLQND